MTAEEILDELSLEEKITLCSGANFWQTKDLSAYGVPALFMSDGPGGLRKQELKENGKSSGADMLGVHESVPSTCFPTSSLTACSWDSTLLERIGGAIAEEAAALHVGLVLGPGVCIQRNPLCGRNFEYMSEDPYLAGKLGAGYIRGMESKNIGCAVKHFAGNSQEYRRFVSSSEMDERTLREIYLPAFETAVKEGHPSVVMCAYNQLNGTFCASNKTLLTDILRTEWGFDGMVVTDWGAMHDRVKSFQAGCDLAMPGGSGYGERDAKCAVEEGSLSEDQVNDSTLRVLRLMMKEAWVQKNESGTDQEAHHQLAREAADGSMVLLKNEGGILPLKEGEKTALIGIMAEQPRYQGSGSSHVQPTHLSSLREQMPKAVYVPGCRADGSTDEALLAEARKAAAQAQTVIVCVGLPDAYESEGFDRADLRLPEGMNRLVEAVVKANPNTAVVLMCGSCVELPWVDSVKGILYAGLSGQAGAEALADLLSGRVNPSGKLACTWPVKYEDCPSAGCYGEGFTDGEYREGVFVGYRFYETAQVPVLFPFGFGLSYTTFDYSDLHLEADCVAVTVTNTGSCAGAEVAQLYVKPPKGGPARPVRELKGFQKVFLVPGESRKVCFSLTERSFALWSDGWKIQKGTYTLCVGEREISAYIEGEEIPVPDWQAGSWYETFRGAPSKEQLEEMLERRLVPRTVKERQFSMENTALEMKDFSWIMKIMYHATISAVLKGLPKDTAKDSAEAKMLVASSVDCPLCSSTQSAGMDQKLFEGLVEMANGHFFRGLKRMI